MNERLSARCSAARTASSRWRARSVPRRTANTRSAPAVSAAMAALDTTGEGSSARLALSARLEVGERPLHATQEGGLEVGAFAEIAQQVHDGDAAGFVEHPLHGDGACRVRDGRLIAGEAAEAVLERPQR